MDRTNDAARICKRCLLREMNEAEYKEKLEKYILKLEKTARTEEEQYRKRLEACKACDRLTEGTCQACGCYVELRAAVKTSHCPYKHW
ncbi:MAG: DUF6171 family protein [Lachnospiraceae bacterium]